jgi:hypothetical protein
LFQFPKERYLLFRKQQLFQNGNGFLFSPGKACKRGKKGRHLLATSILMAKRLAEKELPTLIKEGI